MMLGAPARPRRFCTSCVSEEILRRPAATRNLGLWRVRDQDPDASTGQRQEYVLIGAVHTERKRQNVVAIELERR
jgi:hypothetical protein